MHTPMMIRPSYMIDESTMEVLDYPLEHFGSTKFKSNYIYSYDNTRMRSWEQNEAVNAAERAVDRVIGRTPSAEPHLLMWVTHAVTNNNLAALRYLLKIGVHPGTCDNTILEHAINCERTEIAALLRTHGANLAHFMRNQVRDKIHYYNNPRRRNFPNSIVERERWETIWMPSPEERLPIALYQYADLDSLPRDVMQSWPPSGTTQHPPANTLLEDSIHFRVLDLWRAIGSLRRAEARVLAPHNWSILRRWVRHRAIAMYWLGETQKRVCAIGGEGRAQDLAAYQEEGW